MKIKQSEQLETTPQKDVNQQGAHENTIYKLNKKNKQTAACIKEETKVIMK